MCEALHNSATVEEGDKPYFQNYARTEMLFYVMNAAAIVRHPVETCVVIFHLHAFYQSCTEFSMTKLSLSVNSHSGHRQALVEKEDILWRRWSFRFIQSSF